MPPHGGALAPEGARAGEAVDRLDECLTSGMLTPEPGRRVPARARAARGRGVDRTGPAAALHRQALAALAEPPARPADARAARAPRGGRRRRSTPCSSSHRPRAARAASLGAHREAAAQYARALRFGDRAAARRARRGAGAARRGVLPHRSSTTRGSRRSRRRSTVAGSSATSSTEGDALRRLSEFLWCPGRIAESDSSARERGRVLEALPPGRELAMAYANLGSTCAAAMRSEDAIEWSRARARARRGAR